MVFLNNNKGQVFSFVLESLEKTPEIVNMSVLYNIDEDAVYIRVGIFYRQETEL